MAHQFLILPSSPEVVQGTLYTAETRVIIVQAVAYAIIGILAAVLLMLGWIYNYSSKHRSILYEEPKALVGAASILRNSKLMKRIEAIDASMWDGEVSKAFCREQDEKDPAEGWLFEYWDSPKNAFLNNTARARPFGFFSR